MKHPLFASQRFTIRSRRFHPLVAALSSALFVTGAFAGGGESISTHVIKVAADGNEVIEADVSDLQLGESLEFVTESGQIIDILKAPEGIEIYLDGELLDPHGGVHGDLEQLHQHIAIHEEVLDIDCDDADDCEAHIEALVAGDFEHAEVIIARHGVTEICDADGDCDTSIRILSDGDAAVDVLSGDANKRVIIIEKEIEGELY
jgi:hypothetical protein